MVLEEECTTTPNPGGQTSFADDWEHFLVALEGGWFSGKSYIGASKLIALHMNNSFDYEGRPTFLPSGVVATTYSNLMDFCVPHLREALDENNIDYRWHGTGPISGGMYAGPAIVVNSFGTRKKPNVILLRTADAPDKITGFTIGAAWCDEPARWKCDFYNPLYDPLVQIFGRVRYPHKERDGVILQIMMTYTNEGQSNRVYKEMHNGKPDRVCYRAGTKENPHAADFYERQKGMLTAELCGQYLEGLALDLKGSHVYNQFTTDNIDASIEYNKRLPLHISLDFNIRPGMHIEIGQYDPANDMILVVDEIYEQNLDLVSAMERVYAWVAARDINFSVEPLQVYGDATGGSRWAGRGLSCYDLLQEVLDRHHINYRMLVTASNPPVDSRVNHFNCAIKDVAKNIHWKCSPRCVRLIDDMQSMKFDEYGNIEKVDQKYGHASDAEGYRVFVLRPIRKIQTIGEARFGV